MLFTHIINPFRVHSASGELIQQATFKAMAEATGTAAAVGVDVECLGVVFPDDIEAVKPPARPVPVLSRSVMDVARLSPPRRFPLFRDLLQAAVTDGSGDFVVFTNMDIILQPYFYVVVARLLHSKVHSAPFMVINRRTVQAAGYDCVDSWVQAAYSQYGTDHEGWDCFVFPRAWIKHLELGDVCIGVPYFDTLLLRQLDRLSGFRGLLFARQMLTAHIGDDKDWQALTAYNDFNRAFNVWGDAYEQAGRTGPSLPEGVPPKSLAAEAYLRIIGKGGARLPGLTARVLTRLGLDHESTCWRWVAEERRRLGMQVHRDTTPRIGEYVVRRLKNAVTRLLALKRATVRESN